MLKIQSDNKNKYVYSLMGPSKCGEEAEEALKIVKNIKNCDWTQTAMAAANFQQEVHIIGTRYIRISKA